MDEPYNVKLGSGSVGLSRRNGRLSPESDRRKCDSLVFHGGAAKISRINEKNGALRET